MCCMLSPVFVSVTLSSLFPTPLPLVAVWFLHFTSDLRGEVLLESTWPLATDQLSCGGAWKRAPAASLFTLGSGVSFPGGDLSLRDMNCQLCGARPHDKANHNF